MATERLSMRKTREILRLKWSLGRSHREVARSLAVSCGAVAGTVRRARKAGLDWPAVEALNDKQLEGRLYPGEAEGSRSRKRPLPDYTRSLRSELDARQPTIRRAYVSITKAT